MIENDEKKRTRPTILSIIQITIFLFLEMNFISFFFLTFSQKKRTIRRYF